MWVFAHHAIEPVQDYTRATLRLHFDGALGRFLGRITRAINNRYLCMEAAGLKRRSEERTRAE
jgi:hypothetical protein